MFPARSDFSSPAAYSAWWYVNVGGGRRRVCSTDGSNLVGDLTDFFRQLRWEWGSPDGNVTVARMGRVAPTDMPPIITGGLRPPPIPAELAAELRASAQAMLSQFAQRITYRWYDVYLRGLRLIPGTPYFPSLERFTNMPRTVAIQALVQDPAAYLSELQRYMSLDAATVRGMSDVVRRPVLTLGLQQAAYMDELAALPFSAGFQSRGILQLMRQLASRDIDAIAAVAGPGGAAERIAEQAVARQAAEQAAAEARAAVLAEEAAIARAINADARALAAAEGRAIATALISLQSLGRLGRFLRGVSAGFAIDMPRSGWAFDPREFSTDARWDGTFQSAITAFFRVLLGGPSVFSREAYENQSRTMSWMHDLPLAWRTVYQQLVDDYNNRSVSITSVYVATWILSNVRSLDATWRASITDPRQARGFVGLDDIGIPADAAMPPWNTPLRSACGICPTTCGYDPNPTAQPTGILPPAATRTLQINESSIRLSLSDTAPDPMQSPMDGGVVASMMAKDLPVSPSGTSPWVIVGAAATVAGVAYLAIRYWPRRPAATTTWPRR